VAYYLSKERDTDVTGSYQRYQQYLRQHQHEFPATAFALATSEWYQNPTDHRCPHDSWLENVTLSESRETERNSRVLSICIRLLGAYHDGHIEFFYPGVVSYTLESPSSGTGAGDWLYDEFRLSANGNLVHEIEWSASTSGKLTNWIIEAADVEFKWIPFEEDLKH
jgi:hypothetical protein